jgi:Zn-dependent M28 family amino/carboxypeptidase
LRGGDPARAGQYVAVSAHLDHLGIGPAVNGDTIYNGADDDASGVAAMLEIARAASVRRPARSLLLMAVTGEEKGLQGSDYFVAHPTVPLADIVADVNVDGAETWHEPHDVVALGAEHSTIEAQVAAVAAAIGWKVSPDPLPERVYFIRSDQYSFVQRGVPSVFPTVGLQDAQGAVDNNRAVEDAISQKRYHMPADEWDPKRNWEWVAAETRMFYLLTWAIADAPRPPAWKPGDVFERMFHR